MRGDGRYMSRRAICEPAETSSFRANNMRRGVRWRLSRALSPPLSSSPFFIRRVIKGSMGLGGGGAGARLFSPESYESNDVGGGVSFIKICMDLWGEINASTWVICCLYQTRNPLIASSGRKSRSDLYRFYFLLFVDIRL